MALFEAIPFPTLYIGTFAFVITCVLGLVAYAMAERKKTDGTPFNLMLLKAIGGICGAFWMASLIPLATQA